MPLALPFLYSLRLPTGYLDIHLIYSWLLLFIASDVGLDFKSVKTIINYVDDELIHNISQHIVTSDKSQLLRATKLTHSLHHARSHRRRNW